MRALIVALALAPATLLAQQPRTLDLGRPTATHAEPFGLIGGLRERQDGTVLIADPTDGVDASSVPYWLPGQDIRTSNFSASGWSANRCGSWWRNSRG